VTDPNVPHRLEVVLEIDATAEEIWRAIATADGISSWMMPTDLADPTGGEIVFHMGPEFVSRGAVTAVEHLRRFAYEEDWASLAGHADADVTPLVTEFLVESRSGGTCSVRVVSSAFGTGADWEGEFFEEMSQGWVPMLDNLRLYVETFPGQTATTFWIEATSTGTPDGLIDALRDRLGVADVGDTTSARGIDATLARSLRRHLMLRLSEPVEGFLSFMAAGGEGESFVAGTGYLFGEGAAGYLAAERDEWQAWLGQIATDAARPAEPPSSPSAP